MKRIILTWLALCAALVGAWQLSAIDIPHFKAAHIERLLVSPAHADCVFGPGLPSIGCPLAQLTTTGAGCAVPSCGGNPFAQDGASVCANFTSASGTTLQLSGLQTTYRPSPLRYRLAS